jgi:rRNA maturation RNase YbeY
MEVNNLTKFRIDKKIFSTVAKKVLAGENKESQKISLAFLGKEEIKKLNKKFRKKNKPTDVLSFDLNSNFKMQNSKFNYLGEIVICPEMVKPDKNQRHFDGPATILAERDLVRVFVHGILHLCGYDHEKSEKEAEEMERREKFYLSKI